MASPVHSQTGTSVRNLQHIRIYRPSQHILTSNESSAPEKITCRKRMFVKEEHSSPSVLVKQKYDPQRRSSRPSIVTHLSTHKAQRNGPNNDCEKASTSTSYNARSYEYGLEVEEDCDMYYDQIPSRGINTPRSKPPIKLDGLPISITKLGKAVVAGRKDVLSQEIDVEQLIEKFVRSETPMETEAWLMNIALCEKLNSVNREMERMKGEMREMWACIKNEQKQKDGVKDRLTMQTPWPGEMASGAVVPIPFGADPAPNPPQDGDYIVPPIYANKGVDCREIYNQIQRKGKKRPGIVFLTHFIRNLCASAIEPPHKLTVRSKNRKDDLVNISPDFMKPIEMFFLAACNVTSGLTYRLGDMLREALAHELRELRRTPRKDKKKDDTLMFNKMGTHESPVLEYENGDDVEEEEVEVDNEF